MIAGRAGTWFSPLAPGPHPGHPRPLTRHAAVRVADRHDLGVLAWTVPDELCATLADEGHVGFVGRPVAEIDLTPRIDRTAQRAAADSHPSQAVPASVLWRRLELQGDTEHLVRLRRP